MDQVRNLPYSSIAGALQYQSKTRPDKRAILYPDPNTNYTEYATLTYKQYDNVTNHLAEKITEYLPSDLSKEPVICALLAVGGIEYLLSQYALLKLSNVIMFPISARNSPAAIEHLLKQTKTKLLLTTSIYFPIIKTIQQQQQNQLTDLKILILDSQQIDIEQLLKNKNNEYHNKSNLIEQRNKNEEELNKVVVILHSSGSTSYPKPIYITNRYFLLGFTLYSSCNGHFWQENDVTLAWGALFHLLTFTGTVRAIITGSTYALPLCVTFPPKPDELLRNIQVNDGITVLVTVPSLLEQLIQQLLAQNHLDNPFEPLQKLKFIMYGGAGCPEQLCKMLVDNDIRLISIYGSTETGGTLVKNYDPYDKRWNVMDIPHVRREFLRFEKPSNTENPNERILIHLPNDPFLAENISNSPDGSFIVGDILLEDPPNSQQYIVLGRQDDTIVHVNGEKTNPLPMEDTIRRSHYVQQVAVLGQNQFSTAALIQLNIQQTSNVTSKEIEENIWKFVEQANEDAPAHSKILRQLIYILPFNENLPITDKGNLMRQKVNEQYETVIKEIYERFLNEQNSNDELKKELKWTKESMKEYLLDKLKSIGKEIDNCSRSIFEFGVNSLEVIQLRKLICQEICEIPKNFLYENSSLDQMIEELLKYVDDRWNENEDDDHCHYESTERILNEFIDLMKMNCLSSIVENKRKENERVFLLTGANGSLGNFILRDLLEKPQSIVKSVFCFLRGSNPEQRLLQSFQQRQLDLSILNKSLKDHRLKILCQSMNLNEEYLGLSEEVYKELQQQVTDIIHSAWKINFNQSVKDFRDDSIRGLFHLLNFSKNNQIQIHFVSSISSAGSGLLNPVTEQILPRNPQVALPQGYAQSKYIGEHLCSTARLFWNIPVSIYRIGQISGDTVNGVWNKTELAAMMIYAAAGQLHLMPNIGHDINWIPVNICSSALVDLSLKSSFDLSTSIDEHIYHLVNPHSLPYEQYLQALQQAHFTFQTVSPTLFIHTLLNTTDLSNPLIKLSSFLEQRFIQQQKFKLPIFLTEKILQKCDILNNCPQIDSNLIELYANYWNRS